MNNAGCPSDDELLEAFNYILPPPSTDQATSNNQQATSNKQGRAVICLRPTPPSPTSSVEFVLRRGQATTTNAFSLFRSSVRERSDEV